MRSFSLFPKEQHWCSFFNDYAAVLDVTDRLNPATVIEFGPGSTTLALVEGGAGQIDCMEDNPDWLAVYQERLASRFPGRVRMHRYQWADPLSIPKFDGRTFDMGFVDGPRGTLNRPAVIAWCAKRCRALLVPTEDHGCRPVLRPVISSVAEANGMTVEWMETGRLSGGYALMVKGGAQ